MYNWISQINENSFLVMPWLIQQIVQSTCHLAELFQMLETHKWTDMEPCTCGVTFTFYLRLRKWQVTPTKNRTILWRMMETMGELQPQAFLGTATAVQCILDPSHCTGNTKISKNKLSPWPQEVYRAEKQSCSGMNGRPFITEIRALKKRNRRPLSQRRWSEASGGSDNWDEGWRTKG